jgi:hypothetical protein
MPPPGGCHHHSYYRFIVGGTIIGMIGARSADMHAGHHGTECADPGVLQLQHPGDGQHNILQVERLLDDRRHAELSRRSNEPLVAFFGRQDEGSGPPLVAKIRQQIDPVPVQ